MSEGVELFDKLPTGWAWATVEEIGSRIEQPVLTGPFGSKLKTSDFCESGVPVLTIGCLSESGLRLDKANYIDRVKAAELQRYHLRGGDLLFSRMASVGKSCVVPGEQTGAVFNYHLMRLRLACDVYATPLFVHYVHGAPSVRAYLSEVNHGATRDGVNTSQLLAMPVKVPPLNEQHRIVSKIEALQTHSTAAKEALDAIPPLLEKFRQSVLASAFRGDLTKKWREQNPDVEPASVLLERIRAERKRKWIEDYAETYRAKDEAKAKKAGKPWGEEDDRKALEKHRKKGEEKYVTPEPVDTEGLPELPEGWCWTSLKEITLVTGGLTRNKSKREKSKEFVPLVTVASVGLRSIEPSKFGSIGILEADGLSATLEKGDVLVVEGNGSLSHIGRASIWDGCEPTARHQNHLIRVRSVVAPAEFVLEWLSSPHGRELLVRQATSAAGLYNLSLSKIERIAIPMPSYVEMCNIVRCLQRPVGIAAGLIAQHKERDVLLGGLEQSILAKAFRGELVPQDPNDEPASVLLEKIKAERAITQSQKKRGRKKKAAPAATPSTSVQATPETEKPSPPPASMDGWKQPTLFEGAASELSAIAQKILACLQGATSPMSKADVLSQVEASTTEWNAGIAELVQAGKAVREGRGRGTKYRVTIAG